MTATSKRTVVVGVFTDRSQAQKCVEELRRVGFREDQIGVAGRDGETTSAVPSDKGAKVAAVAAAGATTGAGIGALWALGIAAGFLPAIGPVIAGGIFASILASAAGAGAAGGLIGALVGLGIPEEEAHYYHGEFEAGRTIVTVKADNRYEEAHAILNRYGAYDKSSAPASCNTKTGGTVQVHEEQLHANKQSVQTGEVRVRKEVVTENKTIEVPVQREEVVIERRPVAGGKVSNSAVRAGEEIRIPVKEEQVNLEKETVVTSEVSVGKRTIPGTEKVSGTVRKEQVKVDTDGKAKVRGDATK
jgi:uncharacterized protein (TIGR02271 family)